MGPNAADVAARCCCRSAAPSPLRTGPGTRRARTGRCPRRIHMLAPGERWSREVTAACAIRKGRDARPLRLWARTLAASRQRRRQRRAGEEYLEWMPAVRYQRSGPRWTPSLPSTTRLNPPEPGRARATRIRDALRVRSPCDELCRLLEECKDPRTGEGVIAGIRRLKRPPLVGGRHAADRRCAGAERRLPSSIRATADRPRARTRRTG